MAAVLVDTHCHLDLFPDPASLIRTVERAQVYTIAVTNTPSVFTHLERMVEGCRYVRPAIGLHPELAAERAGELPLLKKLLVRTRYVGEVGLDYVSAGPADRVTQRRILTAVVEWCDMAGGKVVTAHSRRAAEDTIEAFGDSFRGTWILHWYSGSARTQDRALSRGAYFSVNPAMARSDKGQALIRRIPPERVLTETDGPFVRVGNDPARPHHVWAVVEVLARLWDMEPDEAAATIHSNFARILR